MSLTINYVYKDVIAFSIDVGLFYLQRGPNITRMFDENIKLMVVPNIDSWLQAKTQQRYSYRGLCDMAAAFTDGLQHSYTSVDIERICKMVIRSTRDAIFKTDLASDFSAAYWVELMDHAKLQNFLKILRSNFEKFKSIYNDDELYNILCRLWQFSNLHMPSEAAVFETLIRLKMQRSPRLPHYPVTSEADLVIERLVIGIIFNKTLTEFKGISNELINNVKKIYAGEAG